MTLAALVLTALAVHSTTGEAADRAADKAADKAVYRVYIFDAFAGTNEISIDETEDRVIFDSTCDINFEDFTQKLHCRTEVDRETFAPTYFRYEGNRNGQEISGTLWMEGDTLTGSLTQDGNSFPSHKLLTEFTTFLQNYLFEHQIELLRAMEGHDNFYRRFQVVIPIDFITLPVMATLESEMEFRTPADGMSRLCKVFNVSIQNSTYSAIYDVRKKVPVYLDFPSVNTEVFLESGYGTSPKTKYRRLDSQSVGHSTDGG